MKISGKQKDRTVDPIAWYMAWGTPEIVEMVEEYEEFAKGYLNEDN